jgi:hypothetical protein
MVLQVPNTPNPNDVRLWLKTVFEAWPELPTDCVAHVFGEHRPIEFGPYTVPHISPERVQDDIWVRVLLAKDAISTGWDCPRAEVMVSFRPAQDRTYIAQLLGRMVRTPLARRIPGNDRLNSVDCLLPEFDEKAVGEIVSALMSGSADVPAVGRVLVNPVDLRPNPDVSDALWEKFTSLPSQTLPRKGAKPAIRLTSLAHELASDGLLPDAGKKAHAEMHHFLDTFIEGRAKEFKDKRKAVLTVEGRTIVHFVHEDRSTASEFYAGADAAVINDAYRIAARILSPDIARTYTEHRAAQKPDAEEDYEGALIEAREDIGALGLLENLGPEFDRRAGEQSDRWFETYHEKIKRLPDDRQDAYRQIRALSREPQDVDLVQPMAVREMTTVREKDGSESSLPTYANNLLCDKDGGYPAALNGWEQAVLAVEMARPGFKWWYRNPSRPSQDSLGVAYEADGDTKLMRPDFLFFSEEADGSFAADIVDPHGIQFTDALPKLTGLATYASRHSGVFRRVWAVAEVGGKLRVLDLTKEEVRKAILSAESARNLYESALANDFA